MKKNTLITLLILIIAIAPALIATPVLAAYNDLTFDFDTTIDLSSPDVNIIIRKDSKVDSMTVNAGSVDFVVSTGSTLIFYSSDRKALSHNATLVIPTYTCAGDHSQMVVAPGSGVSAHSFTITVSSDTCSDSSGGSVSGGTTGGGGGSSPASSDDEDTDAEEEEVVSEVEPADTTSESVDPRSAQIEQILSEAQIVNSGEVGQITTSVGASRDLALETETDEAIVKKVTEGSSPSTETNSKIINFVTYGTISTKILGAGERAGVVNSYKSAFGSLPETESDWADVIKIGNGRWPGKTSQTAEDRALINFKVVYLREPDRTNPHDDAAITVMAYGLRSDNRNLDSEKVAIKTFKSIYGYNPEKATAWDVVRAIAYSGATR